MKSFTTVAISFDSYLFPIFLQIIFLLNSSALCPLSTFIAQHCCCTKNGAWLLGYISFSTRLNQIGFLCSQSSGFISSTIDIFFNALNLIFPLLWYFLKAVEWFLSRLHCWISVDTNTILQSTNYKYSDGNAVQLCSQSFNSPKCNHHHHLSPLPSTYY